MYEHDYLIDCDDYHSPAPVALILAIYMSNYACKYIRKQTDINQKCFEVFIWKLLIALETT